MTGVDACEAAPEDAHRIHVEATRRLCEGCADFGCGFVHLSTNYVFDGRSGPYSETDPTGPLNVYGQTKLEGERFVLDGALRGFVARTAVLYGCEAPSGPNFVTWAAGALSRRERIRIVTDEWSNPTPVSELARALLAACRAGVTGLYHVAGGEFLSRMAMVESLCKVMGLDRSLVTPVRSAELGQRARRPLGTGLRIDRAQAAGLLVARPFEDHLRELAPRLQRALGSS
jgi:dTDP-4-dehydrorhamnose reductase